MSEPVKTKDPYREAVEEGTKTFLSQMGATDTSNMHLTLGPEGSGYWIARHAARNAAMAMLQAAEKANASPMVIKALYVAAGETAYD